jgi:hypothetical protein
MPTTNAPAVTTANPTTAPPAAVTGATKAAKPTKVALQVSYQALITGLQALYQPSDVFLLRDGSYTRDELIAELTGMVTAAEATKTANQTWRITVQAERAVEVKMRPLRDGIHAILQARFGKDSTQLTQFGFVPSKATKKAAVTKAAAVQKGKATRTARNTMGKVQKKSVKGTLPAQVADAVTLLGSKSKGGAPVAAPVTPPMPPAAPAPAPAAGPAPKAAS